MDGNNLMTLGLLLALLLVVLTVILGSYLHRNVFNPEGKGLEKQTARILRRFALMRRCRLLENLTLEQDGETVCIPHLVAGPFGLLVVHTCTRRGEYYGQPDDKNWVVLLGTVRTSIPNPLLEQQRAVQGVRQLLAKEKIYNIPVEQVVYLPSPSKKTINYVNDERIYTQGKLGGLLERTRFDKDAGINVERVVELLSPHCSKS